MDPLESAREPARIGPQPSPAVAFFADGDALQDVETRSRYGGYFVLGTGFGLGGLLGATIYALTGDGKAALYWVASTMVFSASSLALWKWVLPRFGKYPPSARMFAQVATAVLNFTFLSVLAAEAHHSVFGLGSGSLLYPYAGPDISVDISAETLRSGPYWFAFIPIIPSAILCLIGFNQTWWRIAKLEDRQQELRELAISAQLAALRAQLNPHFLFNSLNSIAELVRTDPDRAEECIERLAEIFRYVLQRTQIDLVPLSDEVRIAQSYLEIEQARFGDSLTIETKLDDAVRGMLLPGLILQPLVENAVKHGVSPKVGGGRITIEAGLEGEDLRIEVSDTGVGMENSESAFDRGVGLRNLRERLTRRYGPGYEPVIETDSHAGTSVTVRVPRSAEG